VSSSELNERQPVLRFLTPASANTAAFAKPADGAFDDPAASRIMFFAGHGTFLDDRLIAPATMFDMGDIAFVFNKLMNIIVVVAFVSTEMLFDLLRVWPLDHNRYNQVIRRPLVMLVRACDVQRQRRTPLVNQQVDFAAAFAAIHRAFTCFQSSQWRRTRLAIHRLPLPLDFPLSSVEVDHRLHYPLEDTGLLPALETFVQDAAAHTEPPTLDGLPLAACPQHIPDPIPNCPVIDTGTSWPVPFRFFWQHLLDLFPQLIRNMEIVHVFRFCVSLVRGDISLFQRWFANLILCGICPFVKPQLISG